MKRVQFVNPLCWNQLSMSSLQYAEGGTVTAYVNFLCAIAPSSPHSGKNEQIISAQLFPEHNICPQFVKAISDPLPMICAKITRSCTAKEGVVQNTYIRADFYE